jgi:hypothetical protein
MMAAASRIMSIASCGAGCETPPRLPRPAWWLGDTLLGQRFNDPIGATAVCAQAHCSSGPAAPDN